jgi:hypothetical protein
MAHFFILTHLGVDVRFWNDLLSQNKYLHSHFIYNNLNTYYNSNITLKNEKPQGILERHYDILVFNWQIGFKNTLDFSKVIHIWNDNSLCLENVKKSGFVHEFYARSYTEQRKSFINQILKRNKNHIHIEDSKLNLDLKIMKICDFVGVPVHLKVSNQEESHLNPYQ